MECLHSIGEDLSGRFDVPTRVQGIDPLKSTKKIYTVYLYARHGLAVGLPFFPPYLICTIFITFTNTSTERLGLVSDFKRGVKES